MNCMNCGAPLTESAYCPSCGCDVIVQKQAIILSGLYYNQGLEKAGIRDLSGAIDQLKRSLKFNKLNIPARNLLGLIYFETGEVVAALSEWVISKNIQPEDNIAIDYINRLQKDANKLDTINQTIKKYNLALQNCREGHEDVAMIQLKKILVQNPKLIKGYHLLALLHIHNNEYEKARKILKKAIKIDKTNTTTLRFLREVDEQTGYVTTLEPRFGRWGGKSKEKAQAQTAIAYQVDNDIVVQPPSFKENSNTTMLATLAMGFVIGCLTVWFLFVPARTQAINRMANEKVSEYSSTMAAQTAELSLLQKEVEASKDTVTTATEQIETANKTTEVYENLVKACNAWFNENYTEAATALTSVDPELLSVEAKAVYNYMYNSARSIVFRKMKEAGINSFDHADYATAITQLLQAKQAASENDYEVMNYLAHAYRLSGNTAEADKAFREIIDAFPGTRKATRAEAYLRENLTGTEDGGTITAEEETGEDTGEDTVQNMEENTGEAAPEGDEGGNAVPEE